MLGLKKIILSDLTKPIIKKVKSFVKLRSNIGTFVMNILFTKDEEGTLYKDPK